MTRRTRLIERLCWTAGGITVLVWLGSSPEFAPNAAAQNGLFAQKTASKTDSKPAKTSSAKTSSAKAKPAPKNPLGRLIRGLLPTTKPKRILPKGNGKPNPNVKKPANGDTQARDHIDARAPFDPDHAKRLRRAERFMKQKNWNLARRMLQLLLDRAEDSLVRKPNGDWTSLRDEATRLLGEFPAVELEAYRLQFAKPAAQLLADAVGDGDMRKVVDVATRYFRTPAGQQAANHLASWYLDRGEYSMSSMWLRKLIDINADFTEDPKWLTKAASVFRNAGDEPTSKRLVKTIASKNGNAGLKLGGREQSVQEWLKSLARNDAEFETLLEDWPIFFGSPSRTGKAAGGDPLLLPRWSHPTTYSHAVHTKMETLTEGLADRGRAMVPAFFPLMVNGKIVFRTMRGVMVVDAVTGKSLWETREGISPEMLISGRGRPTANNYSSFNRMRFGGSVSSGTAGDRDPLTGLLFRNGTYGNISSDGKRLFVIEAHAVLSPQQPGYNYSNDPEKSDRYRRSWRTNQLAAYDLETGRPLWEVGGRKRDESFDLPLAGNYFFGTPVADRGELFIVGESNSEIRVFALDAATGKPKWSQLIAYADTRIYRDFGRRWFTSQIAIRDGMLICPTTVGWMVAVDRLNHSVLWAHRYTKPGAKPVGSTTRNRFGASQTHMVQSTELNGRWSPSAPAISHGHVVYTPSEHADICCLKLLDGKQAWKIPKSDYLYLAGVFGQRVVLVSKTKITAVKLQDGTTDWSLPIPPTAGRPSGMGVAVDDRYHLPLSTGQLWSVDLNTGKLLTTLYLSGQSQPLGNLAMYRGMLLSLNPFGMTSFEQRAAIEAKIKARKAMSPNDAWALLREVEILILERDYPKALASLRKIPATAITPDISARYRTAMIESLNAVIRKDIRGAGVEARELAAFVKTDEERFAYRRLAAERHDARGELEEAFAIYLDLSSKSGRRTVRRADNSRIEVKMDHWLAGRIADLYTRADKSLRAKMDAPILAKAKSAAEGDATAQNQFCTLFAFHPSVVAMEDRLIERHFNNQNFSSAEQLLLARTRGTNRPLAAQAFLLLAKRLHASGQKRSAAAAFAKLERDFADLKLRDGQTVKQTLAALRTAGVMSLLSAHQPVSWRGTKMVIEESGTQYSSYSDQELAIKAGRGPFFRDRRFKIDRTQQQLQITHADTGNMSWLVPLRGRNNVSQNTNVTAKAAGHTIVLVNRGVIHCLSPVDRRVLWTRPLESRGTSAPSSPYAVSYSSSGPRQLEPMRNGRSAISRMSVLRSSELGSGVAVANGRYIGVFGRRKFIAIDAMTGDELWTYHKLPAGTRIYGTRDLLFVIPTTTADAYAVRAIDGKRLAIKNVHALIESSIGSIGNDLVQLEVKSSSFLGFSRESTTLKLTDPTTGKARWSHSYKTGTTFSRAQDGAIIVMTKAGKLELIDPITGAVKPIATVAKTDLRSKSQIYAVMDRDTLLLIANSSGGGSTYYSGGMSTVRIHGLILAFDRRTGQQLWKQDVKSRNLILQYLSHSPVLTFSSRKYIRQGNTSYSTMRLMVIDKRSGERLVDQEKPTSQYYRSLNVNLRERYIELISYNSRLRLIATDQKTAKTAAVPAAKPGDGS